MKTTTHTRLRRTAAEAVGSIPGIEAVVLYGSRARGTARATSDWDVVILSHASPDDERAARRVFDDLERVHPIVMKPESIEAHCNEGLRIESAIARQGRLLAGEWTPPPCRTGDLDVEPEDFRKHLETATLDLQSALVALCYAARPRASLRPQGRRGIAAGGRSGGQDRHRGIRALAGRRCTTSTSWRRSSRTLTAGARAKPRTGGRSQRPSARSTAIRRPLTEPATKPSRSRCRTEPSRRLRCTLRLQTRWIRWYAERHPEMRDAAVAAAGEIAYIADRMEDAGRLRQHRRRAPGAGTGVGRRSPINRGRIRPGERTLPIATDGTRCVQPRRSSPTAPRAERVAC